MNDIHSTHEELRNFKRYEKDARGRLMDREEEVRLFKELKRKGGKDPVIIDKIVRAHQRFVVAQSIRLKKSGNAIPLMDLIQVGNIGLLKGIKKFDVNRNLRFLTYASNWIKAEQMILIKDMQGPVKYSRTILLKKARRGISLSPVENDSNTGENLHDFFVSQDPTSENKLGADEIIDKKFLQEHVRSIVASTGMNSREREIVQERLMTDKGEGGPTLEELGARYGVTRERVRQVQVRLTRQLEKRLQEFKAA